MSIEKIKSRIKEKMTRAPDLKAKVKFDFGDDGAIYADTSKAPAELTTENEGAPDNFEPDLTLVTSQETFTKILDGTQDPNIAFMMGKLKVKGSMGLAMKLNAALED